MWTQNICSVFALKVAFSNLSGIVWTRPQTYFPWQIRFNKLGFAEICHEFLCTISFLVVSCHKWLTMMGIRCKLCKTKKQKKSIETKLVFLFLKYYFPATSTPQFRWPQMTSVRVFFSDSSFSYSFLVAFRLFLLWLNRLTRILPWLSQVGSFFMSYF